MSDEHEDNAFNTWRLPSKADVEKALAALPKPRPDHEGGFLIPRDMLSYFEEQAEESEA